MSVDPTTSFVATLTTSKNASASGSAGGLIRTEKLPLGECPFAMSKGSRAKAEESNAAVTSRIAKRMVSWANVKEHATQSAGAHVDHGVRVVATGDHENRAADRGCCVSACWASSFILESSLNGVEP